MKKLFPNYIIIIFFSLIYFPMFFWFTFDDNQKIHSSEEKRNFAVFPELKCSAKQKQKCLNRFLNQKFQNQLEAAVSDRFPIRPRIIVASKFLERNLVELAYLFTKDPAIPADLKSGIYVSRDKTRLMASPIEFDEESIQAINKRLVNYAELIKTFPDLNFYVFYIQRIQDSPYHPLNDYFPNADKGQGISFFEANLPEGLTLEKNLYSGYKDYLDLSFATDHHWNIRGACKAYELVYRELAQNYPDIPEQMVCNQYIELKGVKFLGYYARATLYPIKPDEFEISAATFAEHFTYVNGKEAPIGKTSDYLEGKFKHDKYAGHYGAVFGPQNEPLEYYFPNNPSRNLLLIGSSYRKPLEPFIAALYQHTYVHDMRYEKDFSLKEFLRTHHVDDILIIGEHHTTYGNLEWIITP